MPYWRPSSLTARPAFNIVLRYGLAVASVATAVGTPIILRHYNSPRRFISHFTLTAIAITFWYAGTGPGLLAFLLSCLGVSFLASNHFLLPGFPLESFLIFFAVFSLLVSWFSSSRRRAERLLTEARDNLELRVAERTSELVRANEDLLNTQAELRSREAYLAEARKRTEEVLRENEKSIRLIVDSIPGLIAVMTPEGEKEFDNNQALEYFGKTLEELKGWATSEAVHPDDLPQTVAAWRHSVETGDPYDVEHRLRRADGAYRWFHARGLPLRDAKGRIVRWYHLLTDIDERRRAEEKLRRSEAYLSEAQKLSHTGSFGGDVSSGEIYWSEETFRIFEYEPTTKVTVELALQRTHPEDRSAVEQLIERVSRERTEFDFEQRLLMPDGSVKYLRIVGRPSQDESDSIEFVGAVMDVTAAKEAEDKIRLIIDTIPALVWRAGPDGELEYVNKRIRDYGGGRAEIVQAARLLVHPDDPSCEIVRAWLRSVDTGESFSIVHRLRRADGVYRWFDQRAEAFRDKEGRVIGWYGIAIDIDDQKKAEEALKGAFEEIKELRDQLYQENLALREDVDQALMFEEVVGSSKALRRSLSQVAKVAPTDSTVLILGETGTGKELIARAIHERSNRSRRAFVRVNCAAIPASLIASELFGHEKGAFTGAIQRRLGRFELAQGGTIFLDEIGELPPETQTTLLRVLQEREFERVGGGQPISVDVRVLAATNRDLSAAVAAGTFRRDLFYRLNVFPIQLPSLRDRVDDIPMLVEYFIERYAKRAGKKIKNIGKRTLELLQAYDWPGNIRELQNVVERAVVLCDGDTLSVDETWLRRESPREPSQLGVLEMALGRLDADQERQIIEAALGESGGRIAGPAGAAAKLGIPRQTLDSKIRKLGINKTRFK
jgi:PAS domain S-box-containing protein